MLIGRSEVQHHAPCGQDGGLRCIGGFCKWPEQPYSKLAAGCGDPPVRCRAQNGHYEESPATVSNRYYCYAAACLAVGGPGKLRHGDETHHVRRQPRAAGRQHDLLLRLCRRHTGDERAAAEDCASCSTAAVLRTPGADDSAASTSPSSTRKPRSCIWPSLRPKNLRQEESSRR